MYLNFAQSHPNGSWEMTCDRSLCKWSVASLPLVIFQPTLDYCLKIRAGRLVGYSFIFKVETIGFPIENVQ